MPRTKSSAVWNFFEAKTDSSGLAICKLCKHDLSYKGTSNNLRRHLQRKHPFARIDDSRKQEISVVVSAEDPDEADVNLPYGYPETMEVVELHTTEAADISENPSTSTKSPTRHTFIDTFLKRKVGGGSARKVDEVLLRLFTLDFQPFSIVEDRGFRDFISSLNPSYQLPTRKTITNSLLPSAYEDAYNASRNILDGIPSITLTTDCWTSSSAESFMAVTAHFINNDFEKKSVLLECSSFGETPKSVDLGAELDRVVDEWALRERVLIAISDNAPNVTRAITGLNLNHFGCFAHKLNSIAQDALQLVNGNLGKVRTIVSHFKGSPSATSTFTRQQKQANSLPQRLIQSVPTRWNSTFYMLERFTELREALRAAMAFIDNELPVVTTEEWQFFDEIVKILKPLETVTKIMCEEKYVTASSVIILTDGMVDLYSNLGEQNFTTSAKKLIDCILSGISSRLGDLERSESLVLTTFLDPRFKSIGFSNDITASIAKEQIIASLTQMISEKGEDFSQSLSEVDLDNSIWGKFDKKIATSHPTAQSKAAMEVQRYLEEPHISRNDDPLLWWKNNAHNLPNLSELVKMKFIPVATSMPCEGLFSKSGELLLDRRNRLNSSQVKSILFLHTMYE